MVVLMPALLLEPACCCCEPVLTALTSTRGPPISVLRLTCDDERLALLFEDMVHTMFPLLLAYAMYSFSVFSMRDDACAQE